MAQTVRQRHLLARQQKVLVAVSGGVDSMVLLQGLHALAAAHRWSLVVAHFNHHLRGGDSDGDEQFVRQTAAALGWPFVADGADIQALADESKQSLEMVARQWRHAFLARAAAVHGLATIALAHHADDQVELFFLRLLRGAGGEGLAGMKWHSPSPANPALALIRPLLDVPKAELLAYARENHLPFRDDATNFVPDVLRNRIRLELLPRLREQYQPGLDKAVRRLMEIVGAEAECVAALAREFRAGPAGASHGPAAWSALPVAVQRKVLWQELAALEVSPDFELVEQLRASPGKTMSAGPDRFVLRDSSGKVSCQTASAPALFQVAELRLDLSGKSGAAAFGGRAFHWQLQPMTRLPWPRNNGSHRSGREYFDADQIGAEIVLRHWRPGDRFQPMGRASPAKLQDLFVNAKIPARRRRELVLAATAAGRIFWVEGLRIGEAFKLTPQTRRQLIWLPGGAGAGQTSPTKVLANPLALNPECCKIGLDSGKQATL